MDQLPETSEAFHNKQFTEDEWSENEVWDSQEQMLLGSSSAVGGVASCAVSEKMVIAKIGMDTIKVLIK